MEDIFNVELETADLIPYDDDFQTAETVPSEIETAEIITVNGENVNENSNRFSARPDG
ncbi:MAG: hypothetical protein K2L10_04290 [Ruminococcus sp.]|nr:hypothetical protein [Ruminococcus sp.]